MPEPDNIEVELELTFLAKELPKEIAGVTPKRILDVYIPETQLHPILRLRQRGEKFEITKKKPVNGRDSSYQTEQTIPLEQTEFEALATSSKKRVEKDRYVVTIEGNVAEVDVFVGKLKGLVVIDFEFESHEAKAAFEPPKCCLADVTQEEFLAGGKLAGKLYADIDADLDRFNYLVL